MLVVLKGVERFVNIFFPIWYYITCLIFSIFGDYLKFINNVMNFFIRLISYLTMNV
jgi:hypothetical protein